MKKAHVIILFFGIFVGMAIIFAISGNPAEGRFMQIQYDHDINGQVTDYK